MSIELLKLFRETEPLRYTYIYMLYVYIIDREMVTERKRNTHTERNLL